MFRKRLRRWNELGGNERRLLVRAFLLTGLVRIALWVAPLGATRRIARTAARRTAGIAAIPDGGPSTGQFTWAVTAASRCVPRATCLAQALTLQALLAASGKSSRVEIGIAKDERFEAHAWLVADREIVLGARESSRYGLILALESADIR